MACEIVAEISKDECSHQLLLQYECKLAQLFSSSIMQPNIHNRIADILFNVSTTTTPNPDRPQDVKMKCWSSFFSQLYVSAAFEVAHHLEVEF